MLMIQGCQSTSGTLDYSDKVLMLSDAIEYLKAGEYYEAREQVDSVLDSIPDDKDAQKLMAEIIDAEIARQKDALETKTREDLTTEEKERMIRTWMERSDGLLRAKQYEQALLAAERVFIYDPDNIKASRLIDEIRNSALAEGKHASLIMQRRYEEEIEIRVERYREQAQVWKEEGRLGAAKMAVQKILLLEPKDRNAVVLYEEIKKEIKERYPS